MMASAFPQSHPEANNPSGMPVAYLVSEINSCLYCISFHLKLLDGDFYLSVQLCWR